MADFFEIDFLNVQAKKSGDAIPIRYRIGDNTFIHITDGGFQSTGQVVIDHINKYYDNPSYVNAVVVSHSDGDHSGGIRKLFDEYEIGALWMLRPWLYADELIDRFSRFTSVENLTKRLKGLYSNLAELESLAEENEVPIRNPFQGAAIGAFTVLAPTKERYLDLIVESEKTPEASKMEESALLRVGMQIVEKVIAFIRSEWGEETFPADDTSAENNMSVIQYANLCSNSILLTADAGRTALDEAADYAPNVGLILPGIDRIQVPHHGSRHNVSTEVLDRWLGPRLEERPEDGKGSFSAIVSAAEEDKDHPRKAVIRAFYHRGGRIISTEGGSKRTGHNAPEREGWSAAEAVPYPEEQEE